MFRRRLIRALFLLPILLCLAGWVWSATHSSFISYAHDERWMVLELRNGGVSMNWAWNDARAPRNGWDSDVLLQAHPRYWPAQSPYLFGFHIDRVADPLGYQYVLAVPFWFPLLLSCALSFLTYRKTRPKPQPQSAFPVEVRAP